jgi:hypothetical protein
LDYTFIIWLHRAHELSIFLCHLIIIHPNIQFMMEQEVICHSWM